MYTLSNILREFTSKQYFSGNWVKGILDVMFIDLTFTLRCPALSFEGRNTVHFLFSHDYLCSD